MGVEFFYQFRSQLALLGKFLDRSAERPDTAGIEQQPEAKREQEDQTVDNGNGGGAESQFSFGEQGIEGGIDAEERFFGLIGLPRDIPLFSVLHVRLRLLRSDPGVSGRTSWRRVCRRAWLSA